MRPRCVRCSEKTSEAWLTEESGDLGHPEKRLFAACLPAGGPASEDLSLCFPTIGSALRTKLRELASQRRRFGYRRLGLLLARQGIKLNHKKLYRLYREERLTVRRRGGRKRALGARLR